jgi:superfamily II RNA helicase
MYVSPHLKQIQKNFKSSDAPKSAFSSFTSKDNQNVGTYKQPNHSMFNNSRKPREEYVDKYSEKEEVPKEKQTKSLTEYLESKPKQEIVKDITVNDTFKIVTFKPSVKKEAVEDSYAKINDFWNDLYQFSNDSSEKVHLQWNHHISKESMVKLLKEQGTIKFNPIEYYRNTIENQESIVKIIVDKLKLKIIHKFITYLNDYTIHSITASHINKMVEFVEEIVSDSNLSESDKLAMIDGYREDLNEFLNNKKPELAFSLGFKHKQQTKFLEDAIEVFDDEKEMATYVKQFVNDKIKKLMADSVTEDKSYPVKEFITVDKVIKKDFKNISSLPCDSKYFNRLFVYNIMHSFLETETTRLKTGKGANVKLAGKYEKKADDIFEKIESLETVIRYKLYPYLDIATTEKLITSEKELDLFEYSNMKDKIIGGKEKSELERLQKSDNALLESIDKIDYERPVIIELANLIHSVSIETNKLPILISVLNCFTKTVTSYKTVEKEILDAYIETYTYIVESIGSKKLSNEQKKTYSELCERAQKWFTSQNIDLYDYQLTNLYEYLSPLSHFDEKKPKLDNWQKHVFELMDKRKNVIVIAPTSSGKTALSTYCSLIVNKVLFVVPSSELARQVCGMIRNLVIENRFKKHISLITEKDTYHDNPDSFDIVVGTPAALEMYFVENNIETDMFQYIVFDEIHQLNQEIVGAELERWMKWLTYQSNSKFLALSACVGNAEQLHGWWKQFVDDIELVVCNRRFLQQQKFLWSDSKKQLDKIHPLTVCSLEFLKGNGFVDNGVIKSDMSFTPDDLYHLYTQLRNHSSFDSKLHPNVFFPSIRITLENCKEWEWKIKEMLQSLSNLDGEFVQGVLDRYNLGLEEVIQESNVEDLYKLLKTLQEKNLLPCILFRLDPNICQTKFTELVYYLKEEESKVYPYYYEDLKMTSEYYEDMLQKINELDSIEIPEDVGGNASLYIEDRKKKLKASEFSNYQKKFIEHMKTRIIVSIRKIEELNEKKDEENHTMRQYAIGNFKKQIKYYEKEIRRIHRQQELSYINIYKPHPEFTFLEEHVGTEHIIDYRRQLMDYMKEEKKSQMKIEKMNHTYEEDKSEIRKETYVSYDHPFMIGMERGVILYLNRLPTPFQRVGQSLIASFMKLAPVTFSDQSLAFGINYPIRSVILTGGYINPIVAHQMIGRAGRRGVDPKGYTVYYGVDWKTITKEKYLEVTGTDMIDGSIWSLPYLWTNIQDKFELVSKYHLQDYTKKEIVVEDRYNGFIDDIKQIYDMFQEQFNIELLEDGSYSCMLHDVYKNKNIGMQAIFIPYLLEEISRWKFVCNHLESYQKWDIIQSLTAFLNCDFTNEIFSETFRKKTNNWYTRIGSILDKYTKKNNFTACHLEDKFTEHTIPFWFAINSLLSTLYSLCKDYRIKILISIMFMEIKNRLKKYTF